MGRGPEVGTPGNWWEKDNKTKISQPDLLQDGPLRRLCITITARTCDTKFRAKGTQSL